MKYIEVERKFALTEPDKIKQELEERGGEHGPAVRQVDTYYNAPHRDFLAPAVVSEWLRLRETDNGASVNYKRWHPEDAEIKTHCDEYETAVEDIEALRRTLLALAFTKLVTVNKIREEWTIPGEVAVAFDTVASAGDFVEFEFKGEAGSAEEAVALLQEFIDGLDVSLGDRINRGYPHMLLGREC
ncbi:class IV adenylate cyclase [Actinoallomurus iriomotensis]|uniref:Adenylate cyclase n=1 Tax=Actinoallomurus iriomotensis TaxID=478107 RepID=A0A9W6RVZ6_9ACTN|nr:class IV adenylate cyclase [Actinoallomurus iriomotensis]GLY81122.1 adenylate cyclase [Actinoallomurus iriomotensis]